MRNGLDISGHSEMAHEIAERPVEAVTVFKTTARGGRPVVSAGTRTARHGTQRMARPFVLPFEELGAGTPGGLSTYEGAVAALGACVLITHVVGYSVRGVNMTSLRVAVSAGVEVDAAGRWAGGERGLLDARYRIEADCEGSPETLREVSEFVTCFSPNHRAYVDEGSYDLSGLLARSDGSTELLTVEEVPPAPAPAGDRRRLDVTAELDWEYGTEASGATAVAPDGAARGPRPAVVVDQAKQMLGIDRGINPQELLLTAVSAELAMELGRLAAERGVDLAGLEVDASGRLDIRGMLNVGSDVPARFHDLRFLVRASSDADRRTFSSLVAQSAARNFMLATLRAPGAMEVEVRSPETTLLNLRSDARQVAESVGELAKRQAAMEQGPADATAD